MLSLCVLTQVVFVHRSIFANFTFVIGDDVVFVFLAAMVNNYWLYRIFEEKYKYTNNNKNTDFHKKSQKKFMVHFNSLNLGDVKFCLVQSIPPK